MYHKSVNEQSSVTFDSYFPPLQTWFDVRTYPSENGLSVFFQDITDKKQAALKDEQHYKSLFDNHPDAVFSLDLEGKYLSVNQGMERLLGYTAREFLTLSFAPLVAEGYLEQTNTYFAKATDGITQHYETIALHKNGHQVPVSVTNIPIVVDNKVVGVYGIAKDLTQQKKSEEMLIRSEKLSVVGELSASIAHEIRNPLTSLKGFLQLLKSSMDQVPAYFDIMTDEISRIESITGELLLHAKPQAHQFQEESITEITKQVVVLLSSQALINNIVINTRYDDFPKIRCIDSQIKQVLINIIKNSIESMPKGGEINIHLKKISEQEICIHIADEGCGIPEELLNKVGLPFYTTKEKGTGLGMLTTLKIIETHGGRLDIASEVGKGTVIDIYLNREPLVSEYISNIFINK